LRGRAIDRVANAVDRSGTAREVGSNLDCCRLDPLHVLYRPGIDDCCARFLVHQDTVQNVQRIDWDDPRYKRLFCLAIERLCGKSAAVHLAPFFHKLRQTLVNEEMSRKRLIAKGRESTLEPERDAWAIKQDGCVVSFSQQARCGERVDDTDRPFESDGVKGNERFFAGIGFNIGKHFLFVVHEKVSGFMHFFFDFWHEYCCGEQLLVETNQTASSYFRDKSMG